jgi:serine/threonine-protein kinase
MNQTPTGPQGNPPQHSGQPPSHHPIQPFRQAGAPPQPAHNIKVDGAAVNPYQQSAMPEVGGKIGPHTIQLLIGEGGMANVYKVWHTGLEVTRAIKILKKGFSQESKERFLTEAKILADINHPNIILIHTIGAWEGQVPFIEMEFVDGLSIGQMIAQNRRLPPAAAVCVAYFVCQALHYAHTKDYTLYGKVYRGLIHRDIKPDNIFLSRDGIVKLMDFGIARPSEISLHTVGDKIMGTLVYLSPEQLNGRELDHRTDIFSLGCVLYEMITGERAFPQKKLSELVQSKTRGIFKPMESYNIPMPPSLPQAVSKALALEPGQRYDNAADFGNALFSVLHDITSMPPNHILSLYMKNPAGIPPYEPRRNAGANKGLIIAAIVGGAVIVAALAAGIVYALLKAKVF